MDFLLSGTAGSTLILVLILAWILPWKGYALWLAAREGHRWWFIILLVTNTLAILDIIYIFLVGRPAQKNQAPEEESVDVNTENT